MSGPLLLALFGCGCGDNRTPQAGPDAGGTFTCLPDLDGRIDGDELPLGLGARGEYFRSPAGTQIDLAGTVDDDGRWTWDLGPERGDEERIAVTPAAVDGQWYAEAFPAGEVVLPAGELEAVYARDDDALWLLGLASVDPDPETLLVYSTPVAVLRFPIGGADRYTEVGTVTGGRLDGLPYNGTDTYDVDHDLTGRLLVPYVTFEQVHRVRTTVTIEPAAGGVTTTQRQVSFLSGCFGEVARAVASPNEPEIDFEYAEELLRFAL
jgi:hypothetical protein